MNKHSGAAPFANTRREQILELLEREGEQNVEVLANHFAVSGMTIRRDLQDMAREGKVIRTHGGAAPAARITFEFRFLERVSQQSKHKEAIARLAAKQVKPGEVVLLDSGTTTLAIAKELKSISKLTVITTSLPIASELFGLEHLDLILLGGKLRKDSPDLIGGITDQNLNVLRADVAFLGADAVGLDGYAYTQSMELGRILERMTQAASRTHIVADSSKIGKSNLMRFANLRDCEALITDKKLETNSEKQLKKIGVSVLKADI